MNASETAVELEAHLPRFGLRGFRPGQKEVIAAVLSGQDCLCVMPTGGGKSLCYQLPAIARSGVTLVVSPLIALMKDQVDQLQALGLRATFINSTLSAAEQYQRLEGLASGQFELVYVVPERFRSPRFVEAVRAADLKLLAIDEAHCISEWGHDFRPDYAKLGRFRKLLGSPTTIALTATATDAVRRDIVQQLELANPRTFITGFARDNLFYEVQSPGSARRKEQALVEFLTRTPGTGIIYASTRKRCDELAETIRRETGRRTGAYHAGMLADDRRAAQDHFMQGRHEIVVATTAFGMGIDKSDVRFVIHYNLPGSLEAYYQEAGRAGRDGHPSHCLLLYSAGDRRIQEFFIESAYPSREVVERVYDFLRRVDQDPIELTQQEIKDALALPIGAEGVGTCEQLLEKAGVLERLEAYENMAIVRLDSDQPTLVDFLPRQAKVQRRVLQALERIVGRRRYESVYFNPRELLAETELDGPSLGRTLRELKSLKAFDYIPPFRGRAIRMLAGDRPFAELPIDFELLEQRRSAEYEKLNRVIAFAQGRGCRQQEILEYFGQTESSACGHCDNCLSASGRRAPAASPSVVATPQLAELVQIALSGVARGRSRFGKHLIAQMLVGSNSAKVTRFGLQRLSTYGLLKPLKQDEAAEFLDALIGGGYVDQVELETHRPVVQLTERGQTFMAVPDVNALRLSLSPELATRLAQIRSKRAPRTAEQPAPAVQAPQSRPPELEKTRAPTSPAAKSPQTQPVVATVPNSAVTAERGSHYWTWRVLAAGFSVDECAAIRNLERDVVLDHALRAIDCGWTVEIRWFLTEEQTAALEQLIGSTEPARVRPLLAKLPQGVRYEDMQLFLKCRRQGGEPARVPS